MLFDIIIIKLFKKSNKIKVSKGVYRLSDITINKLSIHIFMQRFYGIKLLNNDFSYYVFWCISK